MVSPMKKNLFLSVCVALAMAFALPLQAQRLIPKQKGIEVLASVPLIKSEKLFSKGQFGVGVSLTKYLKRENYAFLSAEYEEQSLPYRTYQIPMRDMLLQVGYMQPILSIEVRISLPTSVSLPSGATRNLTKGNRSCPMGQRFLTALDSFMVGRCIYHSNYS